MMPFFVASNIHIKVMNYLKTLGMLGSLLKKKNWLCDAILKIKDSESLRMKVRKTYRREMRGEGENKLMLSYFCHRIFCAL